MIKRASSEWAITCILAVTACGGHSVHDNAREQAGAGSDQAGSGSSSAGAQSSGGPSVAGSPVGGTATASLGGASPGPGPRPSSGCGRPLPAAQIPTIPGSRTGYTEGSAHVTGETLGAPRPERAGSRQIYVRVPVDYDPATPYRVVYLASGCGSQGAGKTNTYALFDEMQGGDEQAVYVALSVPDNAVNPGCYDNNSGPESQEWEAFEAIHTVVESYYCVDNDRIYIAGYSSGATLANQWGCYFGGASSAALDRPDLDASRTERKFAPQFAMRGALGVNGFLPPNQPVPCNGPAARLWIHDSLDKSNLIQTEAAALDLALQTNGCTGNHADGPKRPWAPAEAIAGLAGGICQEYTGCPAEMAARYPIVFCTTNAYGHADQAVNAIPAFASFLQYAEQAK
jgi:poly(3-hydroxybutyrate) depolymerase